MLSEMIRVQDALNRVAGFDAFRDNAVDDLLVALQTELGEVYQELKFEWCWWKPELSLEQLDEKALHEELADSWHFLLSLIGYLRDATVQHDIDEARKADPKTSQAEIKLVTEMAYTSFEKAIKSVDDAIRQDEQAVLAYHAEDETAFPFSKKQWHEFNLPEPYRAVRHVMSLIAPYELAPEIVTQGAGYLFMAGIQHGLTRQKLVEEYAAKVRTNVERWKENGVAYGKEPAISLVEERLEALLKSMEPAEEAAEEVAV